MKICPHCYEAVKESELILVASFNPHGCVCDPKVWSFKKIPICESFFPRDEAPTTCFYCEHDEACHIEGNENECLRIRQVLREQKRMQNRVLPSL